MNNFSLGNYFVKLFMSIALSSVLLSSVKADTSYGPLKAGETLSSIVSQNYLVSPYEDSVLMAEILRMNPQAFINNNMGLIKQGVMLTLPSDATMRRLQGRRVRATPSLTTEPARTGAQTVPPARTSASVSALALTQIRNERDRAKLRLRRLESESAAKIAALNTKIEQLTRDNAVEQRATTEQEPLIQHQRMLAQQQRLAELESSVVALKAASQATQSTYQATVDGLQRALTAAEKAPATPAAVARLGDESVQQVAADPYQQQIVALTQQQKQRIATLNEQQEQKITALAKLTEQQAMLQSRTDELQRSNDAKAVEIDELSKRNAELTATLADTQATLDLQTAAANDNTADTQQTVAATPTETPAEAPQKSLSDALLRGEPITQQQIMQRLNKPITSPTWALLLAAFALGFMSLMLLFNRSIRQFAPVGAASTVHENFLARDEAHEVVFKTGGPSKPAVVFRTGGPSKPEAVSRTEGAVERSADVPEIAAEAEVLLAPPNRDSSRVAILDPSMAAIAKTAANGSAWAAPDADPTGTSSGNQLTIEAETSQVETKTRESFETRLKRLMAEAYRELGDDAAAKELLAEIHPQKA